MNQWMIWRYLYARKPPYSRSIERKVLVQKMSFFLYGMDWNGICYHSLSLKRMTIGYFISEYYLCIFQLFQALNAELELAGCFTFR